MRGDIVIIAAMTARGRVIGKNNRLPWRLPEDMRRFRQTTTGHAVVMGRRTFESIGQPLAKRENIVVSRNPNFFAAGASVAPSLPAAIKLARQKSAGDVFIIGGAQIYAAALPLAQKMLLTEVPDEVDGDARFPPFNFKNGGAWRREKEEQAADGSCLFVEYVRANAAD